MPNKPTLSVVIPVYKTSATLGRCLEAIQKQTLQAIEIIVVDDCSPEDEKRVVECYQKQGLNITYVRHEQNQSQYMARQTGGKLATGEYITHLDADDIVLPTMYEVLYQKAKAADADIAQCVSVSCSDTESFADKEINAFSVSELDAFSGPKGELFKRFFVESITGWQLWYKIYRLDIWQKAQQHLPSHHISQCDDILPSFFVFYEASSFVAVNEPLHVWVRHDNATSNAKPSVEKAKVFIENNSFCIRVIKEFLVENNLWRAPYKAALEGEAGWVGKVCRFGFKHTLSKLSLDELSSLFSLDGGESSIPYLLYGSYKEHQQFESLKERLTYLQNLCQERGQSLDQLQHEHNRLKKDYDDIQNSTRFKWAGKVANLINHLSVWRILSRDNISKKHI